MFVHRPAPRNPPLEREVYARAGRSVFLTIRAAGKTSPFAADAFNARIVAALLDERRRSRCSLYAYRLMPDHLHVLVSPSSEGDSVLDMIRRFKGASTRIAWRYGIVGRLWQPRLYDRVLRRDEAIDRVCEYIRYNPVRRGLAVTPEAYRWAGVVDPPGA